MLCAFFRFKVMSSDTTDVVADLAFTNLRCHRNHHLLLIIFHVSRIDDAKLIMVMIARVSVCVSLCPSQHSNTAARTRV